MVAITGSEDKGKHYRYSWTFSLSREQVAEYQDTRKITVKLDPYRVCDIYDVGGGPREHIIKKALRGAAKGHTERELVDELQACLTRWGEMLDEEGVK